LLTLSLASVFVGEKVSGRAVEYGMVGAHQIVTDRGTDIVHVRTGEDEGIVHIVMQWGYSWGYLNFDLGVNCCLIGRDGIKVPFIQRVRFVEWSVDIYDGTEALFNVYFGTGWVVVGVAIQSIETIKLVLFVPKR
jgi:hypothetical protein